MAEASAGGTRALESGSRDLMAQGWGGRVSEALPGNRGNGREAAGGEARSPPRPIRRRPARAEPPASDASADPALQREKVRPGLVPAPRTCLCVFAATACLFPSVYCSVCVTFSVFLSVFFVYSLFLSFSPPHVLHLALPGSICLNVSLSSLPSLVFLSLCVPPSLSSYLCPLSPTLLPSLSFRG